MENSPLGSSSSGGGDGSYFARVLRGDPRLERVPLLPRRHLALPRVGIRLRCWTDLTPKFTDKIIMICLLRHFDKFGLSFPLCDFCMMLEWTGSFILKDELIHPAGAWEYSFRRLLLDVPDNVDMVIFPNYVSMFKKNYDHLPKDTYFGLYKEATRGNPNYFLTYGNGKSAARVQEHLRPNGAHRWHNYMKTPNEIKLEEAAILHYTYTKFSDLTSRRDRCGCKPTKEDVKRCFILEFDRLAFIIASTATEEEMRNWFREHVLWNDKDTNLKLLRKGAIIRGLKESGVFTTAVTSAKAHKEKQSNMGLPNITQSSGDPLKATVRKILEMVDAQEEAMPPLSPPSFLNPIVESDLS
uniref:Uncharacterized protein n=1 Tax=Leersia perrieri TaxID=77586 RepID=A0A0D9UYP6_9ORYZ